MQETTIPRAKKTLIRFNDSLLAIIDIATKARRITKTKLINLAVKEWVQSHKEEIQQDIRKFEELLQSE